MYAAKAPGLSLKGLFLNVLHVEDGAVRAEVVHTSFRGPNILYQLRLLSGETCQALISSHHNHRIGESIGITPEVDNLVVFPKKNDGPH
ncbi:MAG: TOBE domain-containing protein [Desulfopila sp.]